MTKETLKMSPVGKKIIQDIKINPYVKIKSLIDILCSMPCIGNLRHLIIF